MVKELSISFVDLEQNFASKPTEGWKQLRAWKEEDHLNFSELATGYLKSALDSRFSRLVLCLLRENENDLDSLLFAATTLNLQESLHLATLASRVDPKLPAAWAKKMAELLDHSSAATPVDSIARRLEILAKCMDPMRAASLLNRMSSHADPRIRSKAVLLSGKLDPAADVLPAFEDDNPRVRANLLESMWGRQDPLALDQFEQHSNRPHIRESINALLGLHKAGQLSARRRLIESAETADTSRQLAAVWAMGQTQDPRLLVYLQQKLRNSAGPKHSSMLRAARRLKQFQDHCTSLPRLFMAAQHYESLGPGRIRVSLLLLNSNGLAVLPDQVFPTQFLLRDGDIILDHFQLEYKKSEDRLDVAFLVPKSSPLLQLSLQESLEMAFETKRSADAWTVQRWPVVPIENCQRYAAVEFSTSKAFQSHQFDSAENLVAASFRSAVDRIVGAYPKSGAPKHLILITDPTMDPGLEPSIEWAEEMRRFQITPHLLSLTEFTPSAWNIWRRLCHNTGGSCLSVELNQLATNLRQLCLSLQMRMDLTCSLARAGQSRSFQIEFVSEAGYAKLSLDSTDRSINQTAQNLGSFDNTRYVLDPPF